MFRKFYNSKRAYYYFIAISLSLSYVAALGTYISEHNAGNEHFKTIADLLFWWVGSLTTVGAGGAPLTELGKMFGVITMFTGAIFYLAFLTELILFVKHKADEKFTGIKRYHGKNHVLIIGYNNLATGLINLLDSALKNEIDIVLVTNKIDANPNSSRVQFVRSDPSSLKSFDTMSATNASVAFVLSNDETALQKVDINTLLIAEMIEDIQENVFTMAEITDEKHAKEFNLFRVDDRFTFQDLFTDLKNESSQSSIIKKLPKEVRDKILR